MELLELLELLDLPQIRKNMNHLLTTSNQEMLAHLKTFRDIGREQGGLDPPPPPDVWVEIARILE